MTGKTSVYVGRRKTAVARVILKSGSGKLIINDRDALEYFKSKALVDIATKPLKVTNMFGVYDIKANVQGGGVTGQIGAISLAIARGLIANNPDLKPVLRAEGLVTRDPRMVERKKYGRPKARKRFQFSKR
ncbi:MAG: 30S ribosomal protein S9 [Ignavibacteria bacterium]